MHLKIKTNKQKNSNNISSPGTGALVVPWKYCRASGPFKSDINNESSISLESPGLSSLRRKEEELISGLSVELELYIQQDDNNIYRVPYNYFKSFQATESAHDSFLVIQQ